MYMLYIYIYSLTHGTFSSSTLRTTVDSFIGLFSYSSFLIAPHVNEEMGQWLTDIAYIYGKCLVFNSVVSKPVRDSLVRFQSIGQFYFNAKLCVLSE